MSHFTVAAFCFGQGSLKPFDAQWCHMGTAIKHPVPGRVKRKFPDVKNYKWWLNPAWHMMLYSCTHVAPLGVKGLRCNYSPFIYVWIIYTVQSRLVIRNIRSRSSVLGEIINGAQYHRGNWFPAIQLTASLPTELYGIHGRQQKRCATVCHLPHLLMKY